MSPASRIDPRVFFIPVFVLIAGCAHLGARDGKPPYAPTASMRASATVELVMAGREPLKGRAIVLAKDPDLFRIEVRGPFNQTLALVTGNGRDVVFFSNGTAKRGGFPLDASEAAGFLLGRPGVVAAKEGSGLRVVEEENGLITMVEKSAGNAILFRVSFSDYKEMADAVFFPLTLTIETARERIGISYTSIELNPEMEENAFDLTGM